MSALLGRGLSHAASQETLTAEILRPGTPAEAFQEFKPTPRELDDASTPVVDLDAARAVDSERAAKNARYDGLGFVRTDPGSKVIEVVLAASSRDHLPAMPVAQSDLVVEAKITGSAAYLSNDKGAVYSEFSGRVTSVVKAAAGISIVRGDEILLEGIGGRVRYASGKVVRYRREGEGSPMKKKKYLLFLSKGESGSYTILAAYEARGKSRLALDERSSGKKAGACREAAASSPSSFVDQKSGCTASPPTTGRSWPKGSTVSVYIDPSITGDARNAAMQAFNNWNAANGTTGNNSGVTFSFVSSPPPVNTGFTVVYGNPNNGTRAVIDYGAGADNTVTDAIVTVDPSVTNYDAMLETMAHEIGHSFGLEHCSSCSLTDSVMAQTTVGSNWNTSGGRATSPTTCDNQAVQSASYPAESGGGGGGGGGDWPGDLGDGDGPNWCTPWYRIGVISYDNGVTWEVEYVEYDGCW
jgi:hypothetical protein